MSQNNNFVKSDMSQNNNFFENVMKCPHCEDYVFIEQINCGIFRHGFYKHNLEQLPPHAPKEICDKTEDIFGCGKPFRITNGLIEKCDYI